VIQAFVAAALIAAGLFFLAVAAIGFSRLPDVFCRLHVNGVVDTLGGPLILIGVAVHLGPQLVALKLLLGGLFLAITSPLVGHLLARAALEAGHQPEVIEDPSVLARVIRQGRTGGGDGDGPLGGGAA
jgi:multicomponent Na+:H+ antiporter subunit G